jgi:hypothetical protein
MIYSNGDGRSENELPLSLRVIAKWETRVSQQRKLIADLKLIGQPIEEEVVDLRKYEATLNQLRNHHEIIQELMTP